MVQRLSAEVCCLWSQPASRRNICRSIQVLRVYVQGGGLDAVGAHERLCPRERSIYGPARGSEGLTCFSAAPRGPEVVCVPRILFPTPCCEAMGDASGQPPHGLNSVYEEFLRVPDFRRAQGRKHTIRRNRHCNRHHRPPCWSSGIGASPVLGH